MISLSGEQVNETSSQRALVGCLTLVQFFIECTGIAFNTRVQALGKRLSIPDRFQTVGIMCYEENPLQHLPRSDQARSLLENFCTRARLQNMRPGY